MEPLPDARDTPVGDRDLQRLIGRKVRNRLGVEQDAVTGRLAVVEVHHDIVDRLVALQLHAHDHGLTAAPPLVLHVQHREPQRRGFLLWQGCLGRERRGAAPRTRRQERDQLIVESEIVAVGLDRHVGQRGEIGIGNRREAVPGDLPDQRATLLHPGHQPDLPVARLGRVQATRVPGGLGKRPIARRVLLAARIGARLQAAAECRDRRQGSLADEHGRSERVRVVGGAHELAARGIPRLCVEGHMHLRAIGHVGEAVVVDARPQGELVAQGRGGGGRSAAVLTRRHKQSLHLIEGRRRDGLRKVQGHRRPRRAAVRAVLRGGEADRAVEPDQLGILPGGRELLPAPRMVERDVRRRAVGYGPPVGGHRIGAGHIRDRGNAQRPGRRQRDVAGLLDVVLDQADRCGETEDVARTRIVLARVGIGALGELEVQGHAIGLVEFERIAVQGLDRAAAVVVEARAGAEAEPADAELAGDAGGGVEAVVADRSDGVRPAAALRPRQGHGVVVGGAPFRRRREQHEARCGRVRALRLLLRLVRFQLRQVAGIGEQRAGLVDRLIPLQHASTHGGLVRDDIVHARELHMERQLLVVGAIRRAGGADRVSDHGVAVDVHALLREPYEVVEHGRCVQIVAAPGIGIVLAGDRALVLLRRRLLGAHADAADIRHAIRDLFLEGLLGAVGIAGGALAGRRAVGAVGEPVRGVEHLGKHRHVVDLRIRRLWRCDVVDVHRRHAEHRINLGLDYRRLLGRPEAQ